MYTNVYISVHFHVLTCTCVSYSIPRMHVTNIASMCLIFSPFFTLDLHTAQNRKKKYNSHRVNPGFSLTPPPPSSTPPTLPTLLAPIHLLTYTHTYTRTFLNQLLQRISEICVCVSSVCV